MIRTIIVDLDGTLLNSRNEISQKTGDLLLQNLSDGAKIIVATARTPLLSEMLKIDGIYGELLKQPDGVYYNGGCVQIRHKKSYINMNDRSVRKAVNSLIADSDLKLNIVLQHDDEMHSLLYMLSDEDLQMWGLNEKRFVLLEQEYDAPIVKVLVYLTSPDNHDFPRSTTAFPRDVLDRFQEVYRRLSVKTAFQTYISDKGAVIQIMDKSATKLKGIVDILSAYQILHREAVYFGDDINDVECLEHFNHSFAMGNARDEIKQKAKAIARSNDDDGIYHALLEMQKDGETKAFYT